MFQLDMKNAHPFAADFSFHGLIHSERLARLTESESRLNLVRDTFFSLPSIPALSFPHKYGSVFSAFAIAEDYSNNKR